MNSVPTVDPKWIRTEADREAVRQGYWFDEAKGLKVVRFIETKLRHSQDRHAGKPFILEPWEWDFVMRLFGWQRPNVNVRRFRHVYIEIPKKNGKTSLMAALSNYMMIETPGSVVCQAATDLEQGKLVHEETRRQIEANPKLKAKFKIDRAKSTIEYKSNNAKLHLLSSRVKSAEGKNNALAIIDELHKFDSREMYDTLVYSGAGRAQPIFCVITTAGNDRFSVCHEEHTKALEILNGSVEDLEYLPIVYAASESDDLDDPEVWARANPSLGTLIDPLSFANELKQAKRTPASWAHFKRVRLNIWTFGHSEWVALEDWDRLAADVPLEGFVGRDTYVAVDLSSVKDLTAATLITLDEQGTLFWHSLYWMTMGTVRRRSDEDQVPYDRWVADGKMIGMDSMATDDTAIVAKMLELRKMGINIKAIGFDDWNARSLKRILEIDHKFRVVTIAQGIGSYTGPTKELERRILNGSIRHDNSPVTRFCLSNVAIQEDNCGNFKPVKKRKDRCRIDGVISGIMALGLTYRERGISSGCDFG